MSQSEKHIVNPIALQNCKVVFNDVTAPVLDISYVRLVVSAEGFPALEDGQVIPAELHLDRYHFTADLVLKGRGEGWLRFGFDKIVPSAKSHLRSFLSPKKIGESILEDRRAESIRHYHGLNESELWFDPSGGVLFTYLDQVDYDAMFIIRLLDPKGPLAVGKISRRDYIELSSLESDLPLIPLGDRELYAKLGECRDIVTNFRPTGQVEYNLKQRLLKVISDNLYSTSHRVEMMPQRHRIASTLPVENA